MLLCIFEHHEGADEKLFMRENIKHIPTATLISRLYAHYIKVRLIYSLSNFNAKIYNGLMAFAKCIK